MIDLYRAGFEYSLQQEHPDTRKFRKPYPAQEIAEFDRGLVDGTPKQTI